MATSIKIDKYLNTAISALSVVYVCMLLHFSLYMWETRKRYGILFIGMTLLISILIAGRDGKILPKIKNITINRCAMVVLALATLGSFLYFFFSFYALVDYRAGDYNTLDTVCSFVAIYLVFHLLIIRSGLVIPLVAAGFLLYGLFGDLFPSGTFLSHTPMSFSRVLEVCATEVVGIFGMLNEIGATYVAIFAFFASIVQGFGGLDYVIRLAYQVVGKSPRNLPQVAVLSSMAFGGMSGSAIANVVGTGAFTIPTMKRFGVPAKIAAAIESIASSGGQIMPPILGAVAFVMADYLNKRYYEIMLNSIYPAVIFFGIVAIGVYFISHKYVRPDLEAGAVIAGMSGEVKSMTRVEKFEGIPILAGFVVLLAVFIIWQVDILLGGFFTILAFLISRLIYDICVKRLSYSTLKEYFINIYKGMVIGTETMLTIGLMLSILGIVISVLTTTGLAEKLSFYMVQYFGTNMIIFMFFTCLICILFGMAVSTVAAYILTVTLAAPAMLKLGIPALVTHFTVFYWSMLSGITPPVAAVCVAGAGVAGSKFFPTCWEAVKLGFPIIFLPVLFVTEPRLLDFGLGGLEPFFVCFIGFAAFAAAIQSNYGVWNRLILFLLAIGVFFSKYYFEGQMVKRLLAVITVAAFFLMLRARKRKRNAGKQVQELELPAACVTRVEE